MNDKVRFLDLQKINSTYQDRIEQAAMRVMRSGWYINGPELHAFEAKLSDYLGGIDVVGVSNGLDALRLVLQAHLELGRLQPGDEVLVPANTFIATALAVSDSQLVPVLVDPNPETFNLDYNQVASVTSSKTKALLLVHLYGRNAFTKSLNDFIESRNIVLIEDNAQALGARYNGTPTGALGIAGAMSFYPGKNLGALGDGGAVSSRDKELIHVVRSLRNYGSSTKYIHQFKGGNNRLDEIQAAILSVKLDHLDSENRRRTQIAQMYISSVTNDHIQLPKLPPVDSEHTWHLFVVVCARRDELQHHLTENNIETLVHYPIPIHKQSAYKELSNSTLPTSDRLSTQLLSIPIGSHLTDQDVSRVIEALNSFV